MPGKVNPVIPEAVAMACADVIGMMLRFNCKSVRKFSIKCNASSYCI